MGMSDIDKAFEEHLFQRFGRNRLRLAAEEAKELYPSEYTFFTAGAAWQKDKTIDEVLKIIVGWECVDDYCDMDLLEDAINALREGKR